MKKPKLIVSFSGGRTSAYMTHELLFKYSHLYDITVIFANTGKENEATLQFVKDCDDYFGFNTVWVEAVIHPAFGKGPTHRVVNFETADRTGATFLAMIEKYGIPNRNAPFCSRNLKTYPIDSYKRENGLKGAYKAIGIRVDEIDRIAADREKQNIIYPLIEMFPADKSDVLAFWEDQIFDLDLEEEDGNCDACFKKSFAKLISIARKNPLALEWWADVEGNFAFYIPESRQNNPNIVLPVHFYRLNLSATDILALSKLDDERIKKILKVKDLSKVYNGCSESCEPF